MNMLPSTTTGAVNDDGEQMLPLWIATWNYAKREDKSESFMEYVKRKRYFII